MEFCPMTCRSPASCPLSVSIMSPTGRRLFFALMMYVAAMLGTAITPSAAAPPPLSTAEARAIAKEAYIYGFPLVSDYRIQHAYFVDRDNPEFKAGWNTLVNNATVPTPEDDTVRTP